MASIYSRQGTITAKSSGTMNRTGVVLPNLPGYIKRGATAGSPPSRLFGEHRSSQESVASNESFEDGKSFFADMDSFHEASMSVIGYPQKAGAFNDTSGRYSLRAQTRDRDSKTRSLPFSKLDHVPSFVVDEKRVAKFIATFQEEVPVNLTEPIRSRKVIISFFLEDNTMEIVEPLEPNSGLMQGKILRRHQVIKPTNESSPELTIYTLNDFFSGAQIFIYNRIYIIIDCDSRTKKILNEFGLDFGDSQPLPDTYYDPTASRSVSPSTRKTSEVFTQMDSRASSPETRKFFRNNGEIVLRFYGVWDDRESMYGILNKLRIHVYVNDNTMEILQDFEPNDGRDRLARLLRRSKVIRPISTSPLDQGSASHSSLSYTMEDNKNDDEVYTWEDFHIGKHIYLNGIAIQILDADRFTRRYYQDQGEPLADPIPLSQAAPKKYPRIIPPHNGFGSEEDSLQTCTGKLMPSPIRKDLVKLKNFAGNVLRFKAKLTSSLPGDRVRSFVFQLHLEDDTIQIREPPVENSGFKGGRFMSREKVKKEDGTFFRPADIVVGTVLRVHSYEFVLEEADDFTLKFMEGHADIWPECNFKRVVEKLQQADRDGGGAIGQALLTAPGGPSREVSYSEVSRLLNMSNTSVLTRQELITLQRGLDPQRRGAMKLSKLVELLK